MQTRKKEPLTDGTKLPVLRRALSFRANAEDSPLNVEARTLAMSFSSEHPVERWYGNEVLSHDAGAADLNRLNDGAPLLFNHDMNDVIGVVESAKIGNDRKGHAVVRFAKTPRGDEIMGMVADGILRNVSFMYGVDTYVEQGDGDPGNSDDRTYTATSWEAFELSIVTVPADPTVGVGRAATEVATRSVAIQRRSESSAASAVITTEEERMKLQHRLQAPADAGGGSAAGGAVTVDADKIRKDAIQSEQERIKAIHELRAKHKLPEAFVEKAIVDGRTIEEVRGLVLDHITTQQNKPVADFDHQRVDMTDKEKKGYSLVRAINAVLAGDWKEAGFEREVSRTIALQMKRSPQQNGFFIPSNLPFAPTQDHMRAAIMNGGPMAQRYQRAIYQVGTASQGGNLVETDLLAESFIEVLRNMAVVTQLGARFLSGLVGKVDIPRQNGVTGTYWVGESGALTEGEATFDKVSLAPKTIGALSKMSRLMLLQSTPAIEMLAREDMLAQIALGIDLAALSGSGSSNQPTGIVNQAGVGSVVGGTNGANLSFDHLIQLYSQPAIANAPLSSLAFAMNAKSKGYLATVKSTTGQYLWNPAGGGVTGGVGDTVQGYPYAVSNQLRSTLTKGTSSGNCSELIYGNWRELLIGEWGVMEILANPYDSTGFANGDVLLRAFQTIDIAVRHGASFATMSDALTPGF